MFGIYWGCCSAPTYTSPSCYECFIVHRCLIPRPQMPSSFFQLSVNSCILPILRVSELDCSLRAILAFEVLVMCKGACCFFTLARNTCLGCLLPRYVQLQVSTHVGSCIGLFLSYPSVVKCTVSMPSFASNVPNAPIVSAARLLIMYSAQRNGSCTKVCVCVCVCVCV